MAAAPATSVTSSSTVSTVVPDTAQSWLVLAVALTVFDAAATFVWLEIGIAVEANPLLAALAEQVGALPAMGVRAVVGVGLLVMLAACSNRSRLARRALPLVTAVLGVVAVWHLVGVLLFA